jgi:predicted nucleotidyltransferase
MERIAKTVKCKDPLGFLRENKEFLAEQFGVLDIALFGSWVKNRQKKDSDLDLLVELKHKSKTFDNYMDLKFFFEDHFKMKVDLVLKDSIRPELKKIILAEAVHA